MEVRMWPAPARILNRRSVDDVLCLATLVFLATAFDCFGGADSLPKSVPKK